MSEVTQIVVPIPPALSSTVDGAETQAQGYRLVVPGVATDPLIMEASDGASLLWTPTEMAYGDSQGMLDFISGSAPSELTTKGREARYKGTYPNCEEVHIAQAEGRKYWFVLNEPLPREAAEYLTGEIEFGISGLVGGVSLPTGRHETMDAGPFHFPRPIAKDLMGVEVEGTYEVIDTEDGHQLFMWFPYEWLIAEDRSFPVMIDPTVTTSTDSRPTGESNQRQMVRTSAGVLWTVINVDSSTIALRYSTDNGQTWQTPSTGATFSAQDAVLAIDGLDRLHLAYKGGAFSYHRWAVADTALSWSSSLQVGQEIGPLAADAWNEGNTSYVTMTASYWDDDTTRAYLFVVKVQDGVASKIQSLSAITITSASESISRVGHALDANRSVHLIGQQSSNLRYRYITWDGTSYTVQGSDNLSPSADVHSITLDDSGRAVVARRNESDNLLTVQRRSVAGTWSTLTGIPVVDSPTSAGVVCKGDDILVFYTLNGLHMIKYDAATEAWGSVITLDSDTTAKSVTVRGSTSGSAADVIYTTGSASPYTVKSYRHALNQAPYAATVTVGSSAFAAETGTDITVTHNDPDGDPCGATALKRVYGTITEWWNHTTKAWQSTEIYNAGTLSVLAADNAGKWATGTVYQLYASTRDNAGLTGPYGSEATMVNVGATPTVIVTAPVATVASGEAVMQITCDVATSANRWRLVRDSDGATVIDTGKVSGSNVRSRTLTGLVNSETYTPYATVWDTTSGGGVPSAETAGASFAVDYTTPYLAKLVTAIGDAAIAAVRVRWERGYSLPATFARSSVAYLSDGTEVASGVPRYDTVEGMQGTWVEEGAANVFTDVQSRFVSGWTTQGTGFTVTQNADGEDKLRIVTSATVPDGYVYVQPSLTAGQTWTFSVAVVEVSGLTQGKVFLYLEDNDGAGFVGTSSIQITADGTYALAVTRTLRAGATSARTEVRFQNVNSGVTLTLRRAMTAQKSYATSWTLGGTTRAAESALHPGSIVSPTVGSVEVDAYVPEGAANMNNPHLWRSSTGTDRLVAYLNAGKPVCAGPGASITGASVLNAGKHRFRWRWNGLNLGFYVDGVLVGTATMSKAPVVDANVGVGHNNGSQHWNGLIGTMRYSSVYRSDTEMANAGALTWDANTVALYPMYGTLEGGSQNSVFGDQWAVVRDSKVIAYVDNPASGDVEYVDYAVASGREYAYVVRAIGNNSTYSDSDPHTSSITISGGAWLHDALDPAATSHHYQYREQAQDTRSIPHGTFHFLGRSAPVVQYDGSMMNRNLRLRIAIPDDTDDREALESLLNRRSTVCFRDHRGRKVYGALVEMPVTDEKWGGWVDIQLIETPFTEEVE